jgi:hypothetical protein
MQAQGEATMTSMKWTPAEVSAAKARMKNPKGEVPWAEPRPSKYHAIATEADGIRFQSKKEAKIYRELQARKYAGEIKFFLIQVPFRLSGGYKHLLDFMVIRTDGKIEYIEAKGRDLPMGKMKRKMVEEAYGIFIDVV